jgi:hypothetical protein
MIRRVREKSPAVSADAKSPRSRRAALLAAALVAWGGAACAGGRAVELPAARGGVRLARLRAEDVPSGAAIGAQPGDLLLATDTLLLALGGAGVEAQGQAPGALLDAGVGSLVEDRLEDLTPIVVVGGRELALAQVAVEPIVAAERVLVRVTARCETPRAVLTTEYALAPGRGWAEITSVLEVGEPLERVQLGDRLRWTGSPAFAPGLGFLRASARGAVAWVARHGRPASFALAFPAGAAELEASVPRFGPTDDRLLAPPARAAPGATIAWRRRWVAVRGDLAAAARAAWEALGVHTGTLRGRFDPPPSSAVIEALDGAGRPTISSEMRQDGSWELWLPPGEYRVRVDAPGGSDEAPARVAAGATAEPRLIAQAPGWLVARVTAPDGSPLPARLTLHGVAGTPDPALPPGAPGEPPSNVVYGWSGDTRIELPVGSYRVVASHGVEWSLAEQQVSIERSRGAVARLTLAPAVETSGWIAADFHLHAAPSADSDLPLVERVRALVCEGIELAAATDHSHVTDYAAAVRDLGAASLLMTMPGIEVTTRRWGHFNAFPLAPDAGTPSPKGSPARIFRRLRRLSPGAVIQVNHPRMGRIGYFDRAGLDLDAGSFARAGASFDFDTIEVVNGFDLGDEAAIERNVADWLRLLALGRRRTAVGNSDSHRQLVQWAGYPRTWVRVTDDRPGAIDVAAVARALRAGRAIVSTGPFLRLDVQGAGPGDTLVVESGSVSAEVSVEAAPWIDVTRVELLVNGAVAASYDGSEGRRPRGRLQIPIERDTWILARARGERPLDDLLPGLRVAPFALTNPVLVLVPKRERGEGDPARGEADILPE